MVSDDEVQQHAEADRREVDPPVQVQTATWSKGWPTRLVVKERQQWLGRVRGPNGRQKWIKASDLRPGQC
jgi:SH3-like domain-containing protein